MSKKRLIAILLVASMLLTLVPLAALAEENNAYPEATYEAPVAVDEGVVGIPFSAFSGRVDEIRGTEWTGVPHTSFTAGHLTFRVTASDDVLYTVVEDSRVFGRGAATQAAGNHADRDTRNVYYISIDGVPGYTFMGRQNVSYVVANGWLYRVLMPMSAYRAELAPPPQTTPIGGHSGAARQADVMTDMPEWFGADNDPTRQAERLERVGMEYHRGWTGMRLRLDQIGNPDPADISISWRGMTGGVTATTANHSARRGQPVHLPSPDGELRPSLPVDETFVRERGAGVYHPAEDHAVIFNPLRGGGANLQSSEAPVHTCLDPENCPATWIHTTACPVTGDRIPFSETDGPLDGQFYGYAYISWRSVEPEYGVFNWDQVRMYTKGDYPVVGPNMDQYQCARGNLVTQALQAYADMGAYVQLRFVMDYPFGSPFGYWDGWNYKGGYYQNDPQGLGRDHTTLAMINLRNERIADIPTWLIEAMRAEPNRPNATCTDNVPNRADFDPGDGLYQRMRDPADEFHGWFQRFRTTDDDGNFLFHCTIPSPTSNAATADLRTCANGCVPYRRPAGLNATPSAVQAGHGWHPSHFWGPEGTWYLTPPPDISGGVGLGPRYEHHLLIQYHERAIHALAAEIARPGSAWNAVANVQFGSLGRWGEWHNWPAGHTGTFPQAQLAYQFVEHYIEAFAGNDNIQLAMRYNNWLHGRYNFGYFNDQTGHTNNMVYANSFNQVNMAGNNAASLGTLGGWQGHGGQTGNSHGNEGANQNNATFAGVTNWGNSHRHPTHWMHAWTGGEYGDGSCPTNWFWQYVQFDVGLMGDLHRGAMHDYGTDVNGPNQWGNNAGWNRIHIMNTLDSFRWTHVSNLAPRGPNAGRTNATDGNMQRAHKNNDAAYDNMGYRFTIEEVELLDELVRGEEAEARMVVNNRGVAPFYRNWPFEVSFIDSEGNVVSREIIEDLDIREWMPRHRAYNNARGPMTNYRYTANGARVYYRTGAELSVLGNVNIPANDGRTEVAFTFTVPDLPTDADYTMAIAILDPILLDGNPGIRFHNLPQRDDKRVVLEPFVVGATDPTGISFTLPATIRRNQAVTPALTVLPAGAIQEATWTSSSPALASVDPNTGAVTARTTSGTVVITATTLCGNFRHSVTVRLSA